MYRVEDKYPLSPRELFLLDAKLKGMLVPDSFQNSRGSYTITSVYFDTYDDRCYRESLDGTAKRIKYRIRIYDHSFKTIKLEIKGKEYNRTYKLSCNITYEQMLQLLHGDLNDSLWQEAQQNLPMWRFYEAIRCELLRPVVIVTYDRTAYVHPEGNVRITLDQMVRFSNDFDGFIEGNDIVYHTVGADQSNVLEVKYDSYLPHFIAGILENTRMQQGAFSKYQKCRGCLEEQNVNKGYY